MEMKARIKELEDENKALRAENEELKKGAKKGGKKSDKDSEPADEGAKE
jgi:regulator of replication initiation timing